MNYQDTYLSDVYQKSKCIDIENSIRTTIQNLLLCAGYTAQDTQSFVYKNGINTVYLALVDDIEFLNYTYEYDFLSTLGENDIIITDGYINRPTMATVSLLPESWFGIYAYRPESYAVKPQRDFSFKCRRLDEIRVNLFLELIERIRFLDKGYVSFDGVTHSKQDIVQAWDTAYQKVIHIPYIEEKYQKAHNVFRQKIPYSNHSEDIDKVMQLSKLNIVVETYSSDYSISLSEKVFRALVNPRPWALYSGMHSVVYLKTLGFDTLEDIVDHSKYDTLSSGQEKVEQFIYTINPFSNEYNWEEIESRCYQAANHNQDLLFEMRKQFPKDFAKWLVNFSELIV